MADNFRIRRASPSHTICLCVYAAAITTLANRSVADGLALSKDETLRWIVERDGTAVIVQGGKSTLVTTVEDIPRGDFEFTRLDFENIRELDDAALERMYVSKSLEELYLHGTG